MVREQMNLEQLEAQIEQLPTQEQLKLVAHITQRLSSRQVIHTDSDAPDEYDANLEKIEREQTWWMGRSETERLKYAGEYIAVHNQTLIDHDSDMAVLARRIRSKYGSTAVLIMPAKGPHEIRIYSTRLVRDEDSI